LPLKENTMKNKEEALAFDKYITFLVRMMEKYSPEIRYLSIEEIRAMFPNTQCKKIA
jgi:hypothetical protein